jgi:general secretion pathway protein K
MIGHRAVSCAAEAPSRERGLALLVVLWIVAAAALVVSAFNSAVKSGVSFVGSEVQQARADALLDAGAEIAVARLVDEDEAGQWLADGRAHTVSFAGANLAIAIADANALIDLNKADKELIMGLLRQFSNSEAAAGRLRDDILLARGETLGKSNRTEAQPEKNKSGDPPGKAAAAAPAFVDVGQLRSLAGMTGELYRAIAPFLTVYSGDGLINPLAAPDAVLLSIPELRRGDIERLRAYMRAPEESGGTLGEIGQRAGAYLTDKQGPAFVVTVRLMRGDGKPGASSVYVVAPALDKAAPYRLIAKRPSGLGHSGGAG